MEAYTGNKSLLVWSLQAAMSKSKLAVFTLNDSVDYGKGRRDRAKLK